MGHLTMSQKEAPRSGLVRAALAGKVTNEEAARALGLSVRQLRRLKFAYKRYGVAGLQHGNRGRPSPRRLDVGIRKRIVQLMTGRYAGLNDHHLTEKLNEVEHVVVSRETVRRIRREEKRPALRRRRAPQHRIRRERQPRLGALVLVDGSQHRWLGDHQPRFTLHGAVDDATGMLLELVVRPHEDLHGYVQLLHGILVRHGVPLAFYGDRFGALVRTDTHWSIEEQLAGRQSPTHFGRMLEELGIGFIAANSPQAKGRVERMWGVLQDRLVAELKIRAITTLDQTRAYLPTFIDDYNHRFAVAARSAEAAWRPCPQGVDRILACRYDRVVARDNTVSIPGRWIQLPPRAGGRSWHARRVEARELLDGRLQVLWQDRVVAEQPADIADFTLVPRGGESLKRSVCYQIQMPRPQPTPATCKPVAKSRPRTKGGKHWRGFNYGANLIRRT